MCGPILERLSCHPELWLDLVRNFRKRFRQEVGRPDSIKTFQQIRRSRRPINNGPVLNGNHHDGA
jgi:hypothetical protein